MKNWWNSSARLPVRRITTVSSVEEEIFRKWPFEESTDDEHDTSGNNKKFHIERNRSIQKSYTMKNGKKSEQKGKIISPSINKPRKTRGKKSDNSHHKNVYPYENIVFCPYNTLSS
jgi:hypothetical protein